jgi:hypothetical protein
LIHVWNIFLILCVSTCFMCECNQFDYLHIRKELLFL